MQTKITHTLVMESPAGFRPKRDAPSGWRIARVEIPCPEFNKFLHTVVGQPYRWGGREGWGRAEWLAYVERDGLGTWVAYQSGTPAGYFELEQHAAGDVQIHTVGLLPQFIGQGLGGPLLAAAVERAWSLTDSRVWLRTCSHDHPHALQNYLARGFQIEQITESAPNPPTKSFWKMP